MSDLRDTEKNLGKAVFREEFSYWKLFISTFMISAFTVGGGFVLIDRKSVV